jgi:hypothetical protein
MGGGIRLDIQADNTLAAQGIARLVPTAEIERNPLAPAGWWEWGPAEELLDRPNLPNLERESGGGGAIPNCGLRTKHRGQTTPCNHNYRGHPITFSPK